jgi:hypothetical protein
VFLVDMGERPPGKTLDRIDTNRNYEPGNCRWATPKEQAGNRQDAALRKRVVELQRENAVLRAKLEAYELDQKKEDCYL